MNMPKNKQDENSVDPGGSHGPLILFGPAALAVGLFAWSARGGGEMRHLFTTTSYYIIFAMVLYWAWVVASWLKKDGFSLSGFIGRNRIGLVAALLLSGIVFISMKPQLQILSDETNLLAVSKSMAYDRSVVNQTMGRFYYGNFYPIEDALEKRPLLFPFFVNIFHALLGYGVRNAYLVNFLTLFAFLSGVYLVARRKLDEPTSVAAILIAASYPILTISATSAGFELFALFFLFLSLTSLYGFMKKPEDDTRFALLWMNLVMVANVRYESLMFLPLTVGGLLLLGSVTLRTIKRNMPVLGASVLFMAPLIWQKLLIPASAYVEPAGKSLFAFSHFTDHLETLVKAQADLTLTYPFNAVVNLLALGSLGCFLFLSLKKKIPLAPHQRQFAALALFLLAVSNAVYLAHYFGIYIHPSSARFFLGFAAACALAPVLLKSLWPNAFGKHGLAVLALATFIPYHATAMTGRFMNTTTLPRESRHCYDFLERQGERHVLVVSDRPGQYAAFDYGAVDFGYANANAATLKQQLQRHLYREIYTFQRIAYADNRPVAATALNDAFRLSTLYEIQITAEDYLRISRVLPDEPAASGN